MRGWSTSSSLILMRHAVLGEAGPIGRSQHLAQTAGQERRAKEATCGHCSNMRRTSLTAMPPHAAAMSTTLRSRQPASAGARARGSGVPIGELNPSERGTSVPYRDTITCCSQPCPRIEGLTPPFSLYEASYRLLPGSTFYRVATLALRILKKGTVFTGLSSHPCIQVRCCCLGERAA